MFYKIYYNYVPFCTVGIRLLLLLFVISAAFPTDGNVTRTQTVQMEKMSSIAVSIFRRIRVATYQGKVSENQLFLHIPIFFKFPDLEKDIFEK